MKDSTITLCAIGIMAMVATTVSHEVVGHGAACLAIGGRVVHVSSTLFACSTPHSWVAAGGPLVDTMAGVLAAIAAFALPARHTGWRLFLASVAAFSLFWEAGYLVKAMVATDGDLYFFARAFLGQYGVWPLAFAAAGVVLYVGVALLIARLLFSLFGDTRRAQRAARLVWMAATAASVLAALAFKGDLWPAIRDAGLEIGAAALPLLILRPQGQDHAGGPAMAANWPLAALSACILIAFVATLGHGLGSF